MIAVFLAGSVLCALARSLPELIAARAVQGLGGGGLFVIGQALIADVVPPRERGRYQGYFGAAFALATLLGPTLGGVISEHLSWRVAFLVNVPLGLTALAVTRSVLPATGRSRRPRLDLAGATVVTALVLVAVAATDESAALAPWRPVLVTVGAGLVVTLILVERRAPDPVLPLRLFKVRTFGLAVVISFAIGALVFAALTFLPLFLQLVLGRSPTSSGLLLLPLVVGTPASSILAGRFTTRTGRYRLLPIVGTGLAAASLVVLATMDVTTPTLRVVVAMAGLGVGFGLTNQTLLVAVQNEVRVGDVGVATSTNAFARAIGSSVGLALFGAVFRRALAGDVDPALVDDLDGLETALPAGAISATADAVATVFAWAVPLAVVAWIASWLVVEVPLRTTLSQEMVDPRA
jgi:MFS family permease